MLGRQVSQAHAQVQVRQLARLLWGLRAACCKRAEEGPRELWRGVECHRSHPISAQQEWLQHMQPCQCELVFAEGCILCQLTLGRRARTMRKAWV